MAASVLSRRDLIGAAIWPLVCTVAAGASELPLAIGVAGVTDRDAADGVALGLREAAGTAALLKRVIRRSTGTGETLIGVICAGAVRPRRDLPSIVLVSEPSTGRRPACTFYMTPSQPARKVLLERWRAAHPAERQPLSIEDWHPTLGKFGASEINLRFSRAVGRPMNSAAWRGWCAVKALSESALQATGPACDALGRLRFDAHKGEALSFDQETGLLRQPLYVVRHAGNASEVIGTVHL